MYNGSIWLNSFWSKLSGYLFPHKEKEWFDYTVVNMDKYVKSNTNVLILVSLDKEEIDCFCKEQEGEKVILRE